MKILVTGGAGFIGSHVVEHFQDRAEVRVLDNLRSGHRRNLEGLKAEFHEGSIVDREAVRRAVEGVDTVFHLAALVSVPESVTEIDACVDINVRGLIHVLEESAAAGVRKLCFASSAAVYGEHPANPKTEDLPPDPRSPYAITKLDGEYYCDFFQRSGKLETASLRFFNVFGPRQDPDSPYGAAVPIFMTRALRGEPITIFGDGKQTRDFIFVKDIVGALAFAARTPGFTGTFNAGYGETLNIEELAARIIAAAGSPSTIEHAPPRPGDVRFSQADPRKLFEAGFRPEYSLDRGLEITLENYRKGLDTP